MGDSSDLAAARVVQGDLLQNRRAGVSGLLTSQIVAACPDVPAAVARCPPVGAPNVFATRFLQSLGEQNASAVCGYVFREGDIVYNCHTCGADPTCVLCAKCFAASDHTGPTRTLSRPPSVASPRLIFSAVHEVEAHSRPMDG